MRTTRLDVSPGARPADLRSISGQWRRAVRSWQLYALILPAVAYLFVFNYVPMYGVQIAFRNFRASRGIWRSDWVGLEHFVRFLTYPKFLEILVNTVRISVYSIATFPCAVVFALMINELDNQSLKKTVQMISYAPHFISTVVLCSMVLMFLGRSTGIVNNVIAALGGERIDFISMPGLFASIYVWSGVWQNIGWGTIIYLAALSAVPPELIEAARIDGANRLRIVLHVNMPTILPTIIIMLILSCGSVLSVGFEKVFLLQNSLNLERSQVISTYVYIIGIREGQFSYSAAIGLFNNIVNLAVLLFVNSLANRLSSVGLW
jgi:putative aldouronate transport system permease protein